MQCLVAHFAGARLQGEGWVQGFETKHPLASRDSTGIHIKTMKKYSIFIGVILLGSGPLTFWSGGTDPHFTSLSSKKFCIQNE